MGKRVGRPRRVQIVLKAGYGSELRELVMHQELDKSWSCADFRGVEITQIGGGRWLKKNTLFGFICMMDVADLAILRLENRAEGIRCVRRKA